MKRIAIIAHGLSDGGAERVASMVANYYTQKGHSVLYLAVLSPDREYPLDERVEYRYVSVPPCSKVTRVLRRSWVIDKMIREFGATHCRVLSGEGCHHHQPSPHGAPHLLPTL